MSLGSDLAGAALGLLGAALAVDYVQRRGMLDLGSLLGSRNEKEDPPLPQPATVQRAAAQATAVAKPAIQAAKAASDAAYRAEADKRMADYAAQASAQKASEWDRFVKDQLGQMANATRAANNAANAASQQTENERRGDATAGL